MTFKLDILGSSSALPAYGRHHTAQVLSVNSHKYLIDCGEGTQMQLSKYNISPAKIKYVFISHLHGDHFLGLFGLISSMNLLGRQKSLTIFGPVGLKDIISVQLKYSGTFLRFRIHFHELSQATESNLILENEQLTVHTLPLSHRIDCNGFIFREHPKLRRINKDKLPDNLSKWQIRNLKKGENIKAEDGRIIQNEEITLPPKKSRSFAYCSDTKALPELIPSIKNCDLLYHEATFLEEHKERADVTFHTTTKQAATLAKDANVGHLIIGHYSARYKTLEQFLEEAKSIFQNTSLAIEGKTYEVEDKE